MRKRAPSSGGVEDRLDLHDRLAGRAQRLQVLLLVLEAALEDQVELRRRHLALEGSELRALGEGFPGQQIMQVLISAFSHQHGP